MSRKASFSSMITQIAREQARRQRLEEAEARKIQRERERKTREAEKARLFADKDAKQNYLLCRIEEIDEWNKDLQEKIARLRTILELTFLKDATISFDDLKIRNDFPPFLPPPDLAEPSPEPFLSEYKKSVKAPEGLEKILPGVKNRYQKALKVAEEEYMTAHQTWEVVESERKSRLLKLKEEFDQELKAFTLNKESRDQEVSDFQNEYFLGEPEAIVDYCTMVLERSDYPEGFPKEFKLAYAPESKELIIEYELPNTGVVTKVSEYRYVKARDEVVEIPRKAKEIHDIYQDIVASTCLRTIHEVLEADQSKHVVVISFNGYVQTIDPSTGKDIRPYLISVRTTSEKFAEIDLRRIEKRACLRNLGAQVSPRPEELQPVKPVIEFDMVDKRYIEQSDVLGEIDSRPNLMDLTPFEFENLVSNLFERMGLQTKQTRSSKDGGVDAVAYDLRPVLGGKVIIQAKRYKNTVGVTAVRDLYGTMVNEGANKGLLVTTSGYGPDAYNFAKDKPIELIDGGGLLYLLDQVGVKAKIIFPSE